MEGLSVRRYEQQAFPVVVNEPKSARPHQLPRLARARPRSTPIDMSAHRPPRGNNMQTSLMRARRSPHGRSAARKQNTKQATHSDFRVAHNQEKLF